MALATGSGTGGVGDGSQPTGSGRRPVPRFWGEDSTPFSADSGAQPCDVALRQIDDNNFALKQTLMVRAPEGMRDMPSEPLRIEMAWLERCDLASIPGVLGWFARRHGRHTPAALVHDLLILDKGKSLPTGVPEEWRLQPEQADVLFRELLLASGVPPVRSYVMWAAVAARTRWHSGPRRRATLVLWGLTAAIGTFALVMGIVQENWALVAAALVAPAVGAALWGGQYPAGVVAGYAAWWAVAGSAPAWVAFKIYQGVEGAVWVVQWLRRRLAGAPADVMPPPPTTYSAR